MDDLYTWDYTALLLVMRGKDPVKVRSHDWGHLVAAGLLAEAVVEESVRAYGGENTQLFKLLSVTDLGRNWVAQVETQWEQDVEGVAFWSVATNHGALVIGLPDFLHPEEAEGDMKKYFGMTFRLLDPRHDDESRGRPAKLVRTQIMRDGERQEVPWRPWRDASRAWLDCTEEGEPAFRGAYMRVHGAPIDPTLSFLECAGTYTCVSDVDDGLLRAVARLPAMVEVNP